MLVTTRHTAQRQSVLRAVKTSDSPMSAFQAFRAARALDRRIGIATVYRNLRALTRSGEIVVMDGDDGARRYLGHSHHDAAFTCQRCGRVRRMSSRTLDGYVQRKMPGMQVVFFSRLQARGLCTSCAAIIKRS